MTIKSEEELSGKFTPKVLDGGLACQPGVKNLGSSFCSAPTSCGALGRSLALPGPQFPYLYNTGLALLTLCNSMTPGCQSQEGYTDTFYDFILAGTSLGSSAGYWLWRAFFPVEGWVSECD